MVAAYGRPLCLAKVGHGCLGLVTFYLCFKSFYNGFANILLWRIGFIIVSMVLATFR